MKLPLILTLAALCVASGVASAQPRFSDGKGDGVRLRDIPDIGPLFRAPLPTAPRFQPQRDANKVPFIRLRSVKTPRGELLEIASTNQSMGEILRKITAVMGVPAVVDSALDRRFYASIRFRGTDWDDLLANLSEALQVELVRSPAGIYLFAVKPASDGPLFLRQFPDGSYERESQTQQLEELAKRAPSFRRAPFSLFPDQEVRPLDPGFVWPQNAQPLAPQPDWEKREFNGREFYHIPLPVQ